MKSYFYKIGFLAICLSLKSLAEPIIINLPGAGGDAPPADKPAEGPKEDPLKLPQDIRSQVTINVVNETPKGILFLNSQIKAAPNQPGSKVQPWEVIKMDTYAKKSTTLLTLHGGPGAQYIYAENLEEPTVFAHSKDDDDKDEYSDLKCTIAPSMIGKTASKSLNFVIRQLAGEAVISCLVYYDL